MNSIRIRSGQAGFTLIELVVVIVLLGILGVTALGKFQDLSTKAADAAEQGVASELSSAAAINYTSHVLNTGNSIRIRAVDCVGSRSSSPSNTLSSLLSSGSAPTSGYQYKTIGASEGQACASGQTFRCGIRNLKGDNTVDAVATIICTG